MNLYSGLKYARHPTPRDDAEKRLARLAGALLAYCDTLDRYVKDANYTKELAYSPYARSIRRILKENT